MKCSIRFALVGFAAISVSTSTFGEPPRGDVVSDIQNVIHAQQDAWNRGQVEEFMNGYWRSDQTVFVSGDEVTRAWQKVLDRYKRKYSDRSKMGTLTFSALEITPLSNDSAMVLGSWKLDRANDTPSQSASPARTS